MTRTVWQLDPVHCVVELAVKHMMFTTVRGRFRKLAGTIEVDEDNPDDSRVRVDLEAASIDTAADDRDRHLRSADFLDVARYPTIRFTSKRVNGARFHEGDTFEVLGDLTIRDTTMQVKLEVTFQGEGTDPWGGRRAGFFARTEIDRRDWGLRWNQALETGGILVGNSIKIEIDVQAVQARQVERPTGAKEPAQPRA